MIQQVIINAANTAQYRLYNISPESTWKGTPITLDEANGNNIYFGDSSALKIVCYDMQHYNGLVQLMRNRITAKVTIIGSDRTMNWNNYIPFIVQKKIKNKPGSRNTFALLFQMKEGRHDIEFLEVEPPAQDTTETPATEDITGSRLLTLSGNPFLTLSRNPFFTKR